MTEEDAIRNSRLAKILQYENFDHENNVPILWTPTSSDGVDDGATVQVTTAGRFAA